MNASRGAFIRVAPILVLCFGIFCFGQPQWGQQRFDLFSGVSLQREAVNGGNASLAFKLNNRFSLVADFSAHQASIPGSVSTDIVHGLFGGQLALGGFAGLKPFARITSGVTHMGTKTVSEGYASPSKSDTGFVLGLGGGIDHPGAGLLKLRLLQVDYLLSPDQREESDVRFSFGVVLSF